MISFTLMALTIPETLIVEKRSQENPYATVYAHFWYRFSGNLCCVMIDNQLVGSVILDHRFTEQTYLDFLYKILFLSWMKLLCRNSSTFNAWSNSIFKATLLGNG